MIIGVCKGQISSKLKKKIIHFVWLPGDGHIDWPKHAVEKVWVCNFILVSEVSLGSYS